MDTTTEKDRTLPDGRIISQAEMDSAMLEAKEWVKRMLERACLPAVDRGQREMREALEKIANIYVNEGRIDGGRLVLSQRGRSQVNAVISDLIRALEGLIYLYAGSVEDNDYDQKRIVSWLKEEFMDSDTETRTKVRVYMLLKNVDDLIEEDANSNGGIIEAIGGASLMGVVGVGAIGRLIQSEVSRAWMHAWGEKHSDAQYVHVFRGSSYQCQICDDVVALGWQLVGSATIPPIHPNCRCYAVYM